MFSLTVLIKSIYHFYDETKVVEKTTVYGVLGRVTYIC